MTDEGYVGPDVHLGARISAAAWGAQIVVSSASAGLLSSGLEDINLRSLGHHSLQDIDERVELFQVVAPGLREDFPALRTKGTHPTNLPPRLASLIGRWKSGTLHTLPQLPSRASKPGCTSGPVCQVSVDCTMSDYASECADEGLNHSSHSIGEGAFEARLLPGGGLRFVRL